MGGWLLASTLEDLHEDGQVFDSKAISRRFTWDYQYRIRTEVCEGALRKSVEGLSPAFTWQS